MSGVVIQLFKPKTRKCESCKKTLPNTEHPSAIRCGPCYDKLQQCVCCGFDCFQHANDCPCIDGHNHPSSEE